MYHTEILLIKKNESKSFYQQTSQFIKKHLTKKSKFFFHSKNKTTLQAGFNDPHIN